MTSGSAKLNPTAARARRGISTTEWCVLLGLVLLGMAVVVPVHLSHAQKTKQQASRNNLLQWGIALNLYLIENRNRLPDPGGVEGGAAEHNWYNALPVYLSQPPLDELANSPGAVRHLWINPAAPSREISGPEGNFFYYGMNLWLGRESSPMRIFDIEDPTSTVFLTEIFSPEPHVLADRVDYRFGKKVPSPRAQAHVLFCDGHVELVDKARLSDDPAASDPRGTMTRPTWVPYFNAARP